MKQNALGQKLDKIKLWEKFYYTGCATNTHKLAQKEYKNRLICKYFLRNIKRLILFWLISKLQ